MDDIVVDNGLPVGSVKHLNLLYALTRERAERLHIPFDDNDYKWILGVRVVRDLEYLTHSAYIDASDIRTLFGIVVEIDYHNPNNIQLWENITNKL
jgi:hypothetical protein